MKKLSVKIEKLEMISKGLEALIELDIKAKTIWNITRFLKSIVNEKETLDKERVKLCEKYANKDETGEFILVENAYQMTDENRTAFENEFKELLEQEIEFEYKPISIEDLPELKPVVLILIEELIQD